MVEACAAARTPLLGVCLGHQAIGVAFGATVDRAPELLHGKTSSVYHTNVGVLQGLPDPFTATRYHSLTILPESLPAELEVTAHTRNGVIMGVRHRELPIHGVQFHPESILTEGGHRMLANWLTYCGWARNDTLVRRLENEVLTAVRPHLPPQRPAQPGLLTELQRDDAVPVDAGTGGRTLVDDPVVLGSAGVDVGPLVQHPGPAQRAQPRFGVGPKHPGQVGHDELVAPGHL
ncbi:glutamine amidotransferase of anthranilate synthase/aminodeoxychorismate synthase family protein [Mycobacterium kansasii]|uniref:Glutamine amidotransferase of anthranilate synthase/aminodeoxychorismate synthase family protein n=1 Tax=Mycobacterium kansasii TaxID=1768 RepID=A0A1V3X8N2_MYCKA|nr:glutamine amidotransferase of anthranilate synthase/aminodeoxychorismate synthase family protein [Mycobacterium kansasii]